MFAAISDAVILRVSLYVCAALLALSVGLGGCLYVVGLQRDKAVADKTVVSAKLELQNQAVEQWKQAADRQTQLASAAVAEAGKVQIITKERVERIMSAPVPSTCREAVQWGALQGAQQAGDWEAKK